MEFLKFRGRDKRGVVLLGEKKKLKVPFVGGRVGNGKSSWDAEGVGGRLPEQFMIRFRATGRKGGGGGAVTSVAVTDSGESWTRSGGAFQCGVGEVSATEISGAKKRKKGGGGNGDTGMEKEGRKVGREGVEP